MINTLTKVFSVILAMTIFLCILSSCSKVNHTDDPDDTTLQSMAPVDNNWRNALPTNTVNSVSDKYETETQIPKTTLKGLTLGQIKTFGSSGNDTFTRVVATSDGGYAAIGIFGTNNGDCKEASSSWSSTKSMLVKYDKAGKVEWSTFLGGDNGVIFSALARIANGNYIVVGQTQSSELGVKEESKIDGLVVCYSAKGKMEWKKLVGGSNYEYFSSVAATPDGGFIVGGKTDSSNGDFAGLKADCIKAILLKYDSTGAPRWKRALNGSKHNNFEGIAVNSNGDIFATCITMSKDMDFAKIAGRGEADTLIFKYDKNGTFIWVNSFSGSGTDELTAVAASPDGGCVIGGSYALNDGTAGIPVKNDGSFDPYYNSGSTDAFLVKYNKNGTIGWTKPFGGFYDDKITGIAAVNGGYVAVGSSASKNEDFAYLGNLGGEDGFALLVDENGKTVNTLAISGTGDDEPRDVACVNGNKVFVVGGTKSSDCSFYGLEPAAGKDTYNCFSASFSTSNQ